MAEFKSMKVDAETWQKIKIFSAKTSRRMYEVVRDAIESYLNTHSHKNESVEVSSRTMKKLEQIVKVINQLGDIKQTKADNVEKAIAYVAGADRRTLEKYKKLLIAFDYLVPHPRNPRIFAINHVSG